MEKHPSLELWLFAHRYGCNRVINWCQRSVQVQLDFMKRMLQDGALKWFLRRGISYEAIEDMLNTVWEQRTRRRAQDHKEYILKATLERLLTAIDED
jgi:hypothetical protein